MKSKFIFYISIFAFVFTSCETVVDVDVPETPPKLVVNAFLNPHDPFIRVNVRSSIPLFGTTEVTDWQTVDDAVVVLTGPGGSVTIPYVEQDAVYMLPATEIQIIAGETYRIDVSAPGFKSVYATTTVPLQTPVFSLADVEVEEELMEGGYTSLLFKYSFEWSDVSDLPDYYEISIQQYGYEILYENYDDEDLNGQLIRKKLETFNGSTGEMAEPFHIYLLNTSEDYYLYKRSIKNVSFGDPFAEPTLVYTNVVNGLGCFGSYTGSSVFINP
jgi:hypothetical protein